MVSNEPPRAHAVSPRLHHNALSFSHPSSRDGSRSASLTSGSRDASRSRSRSRSASPAPKPNEPRRHPRYNAPLPAPAGGHVIDYDRSNEDNRTGERVLSSSSSGSSGANGTRAQLFPTAAVELGEALHRLLNSVKPCQSHLILPEAPPVPPRQHSSTLSVVLPQGSSSNSVSPAFFTDYYRTSPAPLSASSTSAMKQKNRRALPLPHEVAADDYYDHGFSSRTPSRTPGSRTPRTSLFDNACEGFFDTVDSDIVPSHGTGQTTPARASTNRNGNDGFPSPGPAFPSPCSAGFNLIPVLGQSHLAILIPDSNIANTHDLPAPGKPRNPDKVWWPSVHMVRGDGPGPGRVTESPSPVATAPDGSNYADGMGGDFMKRQRRTQSLSQAAVHRDVFPQHDLASDENSNSRSDGGPEGHGGDLDVLRPLPIRRPPPKLARAASMSDVLRGHKMTKQQREYEGMGGDPRQNGPTELQVFQNPNPLHAHRVWYAPQWSQNRQVGNTNLDNLWNMKDNLKVLNNLSKLPALHLWFDKDKVSKGHRATGFMLSKLVIPMVYGLALALTALWLCFPLASPEGGLTNNVGFLFYTVMWCAVVGFVPVEWVHLMLNNKRNFRPMLWMAVIPVVHIVAGLCGVFPIPFNVALVAVPCFVGACVQTYFCMPDEIRQMPNVFKEWLKCLMVLFYPPALWLFFVSMTFIFERINIWTGSEWAQLGMALLFPIATELWRMLFIAMLSRVNLDLVFVLPQLAELVGGFYSAVLNSSLQSPLSFCLILVGNQVLFFYLPFKVWRASRRYDFNDEQYRQCFKKHNVFLITDWISQATSQAIAPALSLITGFFLRSGPNTAYYASIQSQTTESYDQGVFYSAITIITSLSVCFLLSLYMRHKTGIQFGKLLMLWITTNASVQLLNIVFAMVFPAVILLDHNRMGALFNS